MCTNAADICDESFCAEMSSNMRKLTLAQPVGEAGSRRLFVQIGQGVTNLTQGLATKLAEQRGAPHLAKTTLQSPQCHELHMLVQTPTSLQDFFVVPLDYPAPFRSQLGGRC